MSQARYIDRRTLGQRLASKSQLIYFVAVIGMIVLAEPMTDFILWGLYFK